MAKAKVLLKRDVPWLPGYPVANETSDSGTTYKVRWRSSVEFDDEHPREWMIGREALRRAQSTINKLRLQFPRAMRQLVGDETDWATRTDSLIGLLKKSVHSGAALSSEHVLQSGIFPRRWTEEVNRLKATYPSLAWLLDAVTFAALSDLQPCHQDQIAWLR
ncbi:MAG: hypothetical protein AAGG44_20660, partial [Planctomycetota bacterium]